MPEGIKFNDTELEIIKNAVEHKNNIFLHGPAGTGKSTLIKEISDRLLKQGKKVAITATTGAAALNIKGCTLHRFAGIGLGKDDQWKLLKRIMSNRKYISRWRDTDVLIIDEVSMLGGDLFEKINFIAKRVRNRLSPMGNIQIIVSGDLLQLPPIKDKWIFESEAWNSLGLKIYNLTESKRYDKDDYFEMLLRIRDGNPSTADIKKLEACQEEYENVIDDIEKWEIKPTILYSKRIDVDYHNKNELDKLTGMEYEFESTDSFEFKNQLVTDEQKKYYLTVLDDAIPSSILLKIGAQVMLRKNLDPDIGLVNGSRGVVLEVQEKTGGVKVKFFNGITMDIFDQEWEIKDEDAVVIRTQIPLILAWSYTIHKAQGCTLDLAVVDVGSSVFTYSQAYVALSRLKNIKGLYLSDFDRNSIRADPTALNYTKMINDPNYKMHSQEESNELFIEE